MNLNRGEILVLFSDITAYRHTTTLFDLSPVSKNNKITLSRICFLVPQERPILLTSLTHSIVHPHGAVYSTTLYSVVLRFGFTFYHYAMKKVKNTSPDKMLVQMNLVVRM